MSRLTIIRNVQIITPFALREGVVVVKGDKIHAVCTHITPPEDAVVYNGQGMFLSPGFIDLHVHGGGGRSVMEGTAEAICAVADAHAAYGTTSILPTTLSTGMDALLAAGHAVVQAIESGKSRANLLGVHFEGPFLSPAQSGAQPADALRIPAETDLVPFVPFLPHLRMMGVAPELPGALALGDWLAAQGVIVSVAHSDATYAQVEQALAHGFADVTHLYSCCSTVVRKNAFRVAGVVEAGLNLDALTTQVIADGCHLPPALLQLIYRCKGPDGMYAITDGLEFSASHIEEGTAYTQQNGQQVVCEEGVMKLADRSAFAGSIATMNRTVRTLCQAGIPRTDAVRMATDTPAQRIGAQGKGRIQSGYDADLVLHDADFNPVLCMIGGVVYGEGR